MEAVAVKQEWQKAAEVLRRFTEVCADKERQLSDLDRVKAFRDLMCSGRVLNYAFLLPLVLNLNGEPYTLREHFPFESAFNVQLARQILWKTARQVGKSRSMAARGILISNAIPYFSTLFLTPLYEQVKRFSTDYVAKFIEESPIRSMWMDTTTENNVLKRSFKNLSRMYFSFALTTADRVRGISAHANNFDEVQDMDPGLLPIVKETMSASKWRLSMYTGTPKTLDNTIEGLWQASSQAEWCIPCPNCKKLNVPRMGEDIEKMIGPLHDGIGLLRPRPGTKDKGGVPGVICAKCGHWVDPEIGRWHHRYPERRFDFPGYHIPQVVMPMHYSYKERWRELLAKRSGYGNVTVPQFYNEVLGESYDVGAKLLTKTDLENAAVLPWENDPLYGKVALTHKGDYMLRVLGIDWGGGGEVKHGVDKKKALEHITLSFTCCAVLGFRPDGHIDVIYGRRLLTPHDHYEEARQILRIYQMFNCDVIAHDYNGAGALHETIAVQAGLPLNKIAPIVYYRSGAQDIMVHHKGNEMHSRSYYQLDKARSLALLCQCIKLQYVRFFKYDYVSEDNRGLMHDFLSLMTNKVEMPRGPDIFMIQRNPHFPDDFAHAVNFAACTIWYMQRAWPNVAHLANLKLTAAQISQIAPTHAWGEGPIGIGRF